MRKREVSKNKVNTAAQKVLGERLMQLRLHQDIPRKQLAKIVKITDQQLAKYESGDFVPISMLELLTKTLGEPIPKKIIRRISALREREIASGEEQVELNALYCEAVPIEPSPEQI